MRAQRLDAQRPTDLVALVDHLTLLQIHPTAAVAPSADLVAWSRLGVAYRPADLTAALDQRRLFELRAFIRPMTAVALHVPEETVYTAQASVQAWIKANDGFRRDLLARLREAGPLLSRDLPDTSQVPWGSTGWTNNRNVTQMLEFLSARGEVAVSGRVGRQRIWDVAESVYPDFEAPPLPRRSDSVSSGGCARWVWFAIDPPLPRVSRSRLGMPVFRSVSRAWTGHGGRIRRRSTSRSPAGRRCCRRSTD